MSSGIRLALALLFFPQPPAAAQGTTVVPARLSAVAPAGMRRGTTQILTLSGSNLAGASGVFFDDPAIAGKIVAATEKNQVKVEASLGPQTRVGTHRVFLQTPRGTTGSATFVVGAWPEVPEKEPNNDSATAPEVALPVTLSGGMEAAGDADLFRFRARAGQELLFEVITGPIRSRLNPVLAIVESDGKVLAESGDLGGKSENFLGYRFPGDGAYALRVRDFQNAAGGDVTYRINAGEFTWVTDVFPLGIQAGSATEVELRGFGLGDRSRLNVDAPGQAGRDTTTGLPLGLADERLLSAPRLAVGPDPEVTEAAEPAADGLANALSLPVPGTVNGRIHRENGGPPDADQYRFRAAKGQPLVIEATARRLGSPLDSFVEVLHVDGRPVERATLRPVAHTVVTLSDRDSASTGMRLLAWNDFRVRDLLYVNGELLRIAALPKGPDDDVQFESLRGQRLGFLDTTPHGLSVETAVYKVQVHPPGRTFPPNGMPLFRLYYRNDDGGPLQGKDSRLTFDAPADGEYLVRIRDVQGRQGERYAYRLSIRPPRPDFRLSMSPEHPNLYPGAAVPVEATVERHDGFDGPVELSFEGLPAQVSATTGRIDAGDTRATLTLSASSDAAAGPVAPGAAALRLVGRAQIGGRDHLQAIANDQGRGLLTVLPKPDVTITADVNAVRLQPGSETRVTVRIQRHNGFAGRVPIDVKNLPTGVRVLDVGLNGVLITEQETSRQFTLVAEPWVKPQSRPFYPTVTIESDPVSHVAASPVQLEIVGR